MASDLYEAYPEAATLIDVADRLLDFPLKDRMFGSGAPPEDAKRELTATSVTQPALYVHSLASMAVLRGWGYAPDMVAGHSLGEYSALASAGSLDFEEGLRLVRLRGQLMAEAGHVRPGTMAAVLNLEIEVVDRICREASDGTGEVVQPANYNAPGQIVISGDDGAVNRAVDLAREAGARKVVMLPVSGAFHSPLMDFARDHFGAALEGAEVRPPSCPIFLNVTAQPTRDPDEIRMRLLEQLTAPVRWVQTLEGMRDAGALRYVEVGTGNVLSGLVRRTLGKDVRTDLAGSATDLEALRPDTV